MSVIAHLRVPADSFELGRTLDMEGGTRVELEEMVPLGEKAVPFISVHDAAREQFEAHVRDRTAVESLRTVSRHDSETVYALDWAVSNDAFFQGLFETGAHLLSATGTTDTWAFEIRFTDHESLSDFQDHCSDAAIPLNVGRIYNPARPGTGPFYGLTTTQRDTLVRAVERGYYSIPRQISTKDLADTFGVSDQAVTERLRRAIITLVENALIAAIEEEEEFSSVD